MHGIPRFYLLTWPQTAPSKNKKDQAT